MDIIDFILDTGHAFTGSEARRLIAHDCVFFLPDDWVFGSAIPDDISIITDPNCKLKPNSKINIYKDAYIYYGPNRYSKITKEG